MKTLPIVTRLRVILFALIWSLAGMSASLAQQQSFGLSLNYGASLAVTTASSNVLLGANGTTLVVWNAGGQTAFVKIGVAASQVATTGDVPIPAGSCIAVSGIPLGYLAAITSTGSTTLSIAQGFGSTSVSCPGGTSTNPSTVTQSGSTGTDASAAAGKPTLPNVGANFAASGPYASYVLIATVPASTTRNNIDIENTSGAQIAIIRDDGTAAAASPPVNASVFALAGGSGAGAQGGSWGSRTFRGRLQIYAASSGAQVAVMID